MIIFGRTTTKQVLIHPGDFPGSVAKMDENILVKVHKICEIGREVCRESCMNKPKSLGEKEAGTVETAMGLRGKG